MFNNCKGLVYTKRARERLNLGDTCNTTCEWSDGHDAPISVDIREESHVTVTVTSPLFGENALTLRGTTTQISEMLLDKLVHYLDEALQLRDIPLTTQISLDERTADGLKRMYMQLKSRIDTISDTVTDVQILLNFPILANANSSLLRSVLYKIVELKLDVSSMIANANVLASEILDAGPDESVVIVEEGHTVFSDVGYILGLIHGAL